MKNIAAILLVLALSISATGQKNSQPDSRTDTKYTEGASGVKRSISYTFSALNSDEDPGDGFFRYNNESMPAVSWIYLDNNDISGENQAKWYATWDDTTGAMGRGQLNIVGKDGSTVNIFTITGLFIRSTGFWKIPVQYVSGKMPANGAVCFYVFNRIEKKKPVGKEPAIEVKEPLIEVKEPVIEIKEPVAEVKEPVIEIKEPVIEVKEPVIEVKVPVTEVKEPVSEVKEPVIEVKEPVSEVKEPVIELKEPVIEVKEPVIEVKEPVIELKEPVSEVKEPVIEVKEPVSEVKEPVIEVKEPVIEVKEPVTEVKEPVIEVKEPVTEVKEPAIEVKEPVVEVEVKEPIIDVKEPVAVKTEPVADVKESAGNKRQPSQKEGITIQKSEDKVMLNSQLKKDQLKQVASTQTQVQQDQKSQTTATVNQTVQKGQVTSTTRTNVSQTTQALDKTSNQVRQEQGNQTNVGITAGNYVKRNDQQAYQERHDQAGSASSVTRTNPDESRNTVQTNTYQGNLGDHGYQVTVTNTGSETTKRRKCYRGIIEAGYGLGIGEYGMNNFRFNFINGFKTGPYSSLGVGIGFRSFSLKPGRDWFLPSGTRHVPLFIDFRTTFSDRSVTPYLALDGGISVRTGEVVSEGLFLGSSGGIWFNLSGRFAVFAGLAWEMQKFEFANLSDNSTYNRYINSLSLNIGISF